MKILTPKIIHMLMRTFNESGILVVLTINEPYIKSGHN